MVLSPTDDQVHVSWGAENGGESGQRKGQATVYGRLIGPNEETGIDFGKARFLSGLTRDDVDFHPEEEEEEEEEEEGGKRRRRKRRGMIMLRLCVRVANGIGALPKSSLILPGKQDS